MAQFARPDADQATGSWTTTPLWSKVEEGVATDDGTLINLASGNQNDNADLRLDDVTDPVSSSGHIIRADWGVSSGARQLNANCELWQGIPGTGSLVATLTTVDPVSDTDYSYTLSGAEADAITDYTDLYFRLYYTYTGGGAPSALEVDAVELETPDAPVNTDLLGDAVAGAYAITGCSADLTNADRRSRVSAYELEIPNRAARVSAYEFEVPDPPRRARVSAFEFQVPDVVTAIAGSFLKTSLSLSL